jgi:hypothetical protein
LQTLLEQSTPAGRERSVAVTKLEEACMWSVRAVVLNDPDSTPQVSAPGRG